MRIIDWSRSARKRPLLDEAVTSADIRAAILGYLRTHRDWYNRSS